MAFNATVQQGVSLLRAVIPLVAFLTGGLPASAQTDPPVPAADLAPLRALISGQKNISTLSADFTQIRSLRTLRSPLAAKGKLWFRAPDAFRWQMGDPPKTILLGNSRGLALIQPTRMTAERKKMPAPGSVDAAAAFGILRFPAAGNLESFQKEMKVLSIRTTGSRCHVEMLPRSVAATQGLTSVNLDFNAVTGEWISLEIVTRDGSSIRNEFSNIRINRRLGKELFDYDLGGFKVSDEEN